MQPNPTQKPTQMQSFKMHDLQEDVSNVSSKTHDLEAKQASICSYCSNSLLAKLCFLHAQPSADTTNETQTMDFVDAFEHMLESTTFEEAYNTKSPNSMPNGMLPCGWKSSNI